MADIPANVTTKAVLEGLLPTGRSFSGVLDTAGDRDWIRVDGLEVGTDYYVNAHFLRAGSLTQGDVILRVYDADGNFLFQSDDRGGGVTPNAGTQFSIQQPGTYYIEVGASGDNAAGSYSLHFGLVQGGTAKDLVGGDDDYTSNVASERVFGGYGNDTIGLGSSGFAAFGEQGDDTIFGNEAVNHIFGGLGGDYIQGGGGQDWLFGDAGNDTIYGGGSVNDSADLIWAGIGNDDLHGGQGNDYLWGGQGQDDFWGDAGGDHFVFNLKSDSVKGANRDVIHDFVRFEDEIDLSAIDAKSGVGNHKFKWIGKQGFHHKKGELHYVKKAGFVLVEGDVNGDAKADFQIAVLGVTKLSGLDFDL